MHRLMRAVIYSRLQWPREHMINHTGTVKWYNERMGFGFIVRDDDKGDLYLSCGVVEQSGLFYPKPGECLIRCGN